VTVLRGLLAQVAGLQHYPSSSPSPNTASAIVCLTPRAQRLWLRYRTSQPQLLRVPLPQRWQRQRLQHPRWVLQLHGPLLLLFRLLQQQLLLSPRVRSAMLLVWGTDRQRYSCGAARRLWKWQLSRRKGGGAWARDAQNGAVFAA